jgi:hypothetical protein
MWLMIISNKINVETRNLRVSAIFNAQSIFNVQFKHLYQPFTNFVTILKSLS